jgi:hypothetical protein
MGRRLLILGGSALLLAGCGGEKRQQDVAGGLYHRGAVAACLRANDFTVSMREEDVEFIAFTATGGGLRAWENGTNNQVDVILAFGNSNADAQQTLKAIKRFAKRPPLFRWRARRANAVIMFASRPSEKNEQLLYRCLNRSVRPIH